MLASAGAALSTGLAGCAGIGVPGRRSEEGTEAGSTTSTATASDGSADAGSETPVHRNYDSTEVVVAAPDGTERGRVTAAIADTSDLRFLGLSDTERLPEDRGMLFVYEAAAARTFVMREMDFGIDIVYVGADRRITEIHHAPAPAPDEDGEEQRYPGTGQFVLEVVLDWTTDRGVEVGDEVSFDLR
ncbi:hypothetical protein GCM10027435_13520 [Haloparvum alkalitolerans]